MAGDTDGVSNVSVMPRLRNTLGNTEDVSVISVSDVSVVSRDCRSCLVTQMTCLISVRCLILWCQEIVSHAW